MSNFSEFNRHIKIHTIRDVLDDLLVLPYGLIPVKAMIKTAAPRTS
jgi:hypothetical protein